MVRRAEAKDLPKVEAIARVTWPAAYADIIPDEIQRRLLDSWYSPESLRRALAAEGSSFFVAELAGDVIGFAQYVRRSAESVELTRIYVLPDRQRSGVGMRLLDAGLAELATQGLKYLIVHVERDNRNGRRFYERAGLPSRESSPKTCRDMCSRWSNTVARSSGVNQSRKSLAVDSEGHRSTY